LVVGFILIGDSWWQLVNAGVLAVLMTQIAFLGHDAGIVRSSDPAGGTTGSACHHANPNKVGADPDVALAAIAMTPERGRRFRGRLG
jgi:hypothetical protein